MRALVVSAAVAAILCGACISVPVVRDREPERAPARVEGPPGRYATSLGVPPGHLPPPGQCRIWYPGRPPGHQPPPGRCWIADHQVPAGAWLLYRPAEEPKRVRVSVCDERRSGVIVAVRTYEARTGKLVRQE